jgi:hypothetical protein
MAGRAEKKGKATKTGKERKRKSQRFGLTRRQVLKMGAVAGGVAILTSTKSFRTHFPDSVLAQGGASCGQSTGHSPEHCPFAQQMPIPPALDTTILNPVPQKAANIGAGEAAWCESLMIGSTDGSCALRLRVSRLSHRLFFGAARSNP